MDPERNEREALGLPSEEAIEQIWLMEADRRARELDRSDVQPIWADEVRKRARVLLRRIIP